MGGARPTATWRRQRGRAAHRPRGLLDLEPGERGLHPGGRDRAVAGVAYAAQGPQGQAGDVGPPRERAAGQELPVPQRERGGHASLPAEARGRGDEGGQVHDDPTGQPAAHRLGHDGHHVAGDRPGLDPDAGLRPAADDARHGLRVDHAYFLDHGHGGLVQHGLHGERRHCEHEPSPGHLPLRQELVCLRHPAHQLGLGLGAAAAPRRQQQQQRDDRVHQPGTLGAAAARDADLPRAAPPATPEAQADDHGHHELRRFGVDDHIHRCRAKFDHHRRDQPHPRVLLVCGGAHRRKPELGEVRQAGRQRPLRQVHGVTSLVTGTVHARQHLD
mmetsp:Transcript_92954/g.240124  ORF Transcript_92954/g.240124 Transcript_92954/m.240124 type:complete len:330 (-) Transcript_92954:1250-2239(-)